MRRVWLLVPVALFWSATRAVVVWLLGGRHEWVRGDIAYFHDSLAALDGTGLGGTLVEYPLPGVLVIALPWLIATVSGSPEAYGDVVVVLSMLADASFTLLLARVAGPGRWAGLVVWLLAVPLLGATTYARFDLVPGVLAGVALLLVVSLPGWAAAAGALATGFKLWPVFVLPALAAREGSRRTVVGVVAGVGGALALGSLVVAGWDRLVSPLAWQAERGLQIESVAATPAMVAWAVSREHYAVGFTEHNAFEVAGPGVGELVAASETASLLVVCGLLALWLAAFRGGGRLTVETVAWLALAAVGSVMVTSKVLSPQYLLWLLPLAAAATGQSRSKQLRVWSALLLLTAGLTQVTFPELYGHLTRPGDLTGRAVLVLAARNLLLLGLVGWAVVSAVRGVSGAVRSSASHPDLPGRTPAAVGARRPTRT